MLPSGRRPRGVPAQAEAIKETISAACGRVVENVIGYGKFTGAVKDTYGRAN